MGHEVAHPPSVFLACTDNLPTKGEKYELGTFTTLLMYTMIEIVSLPFLVIKLFSCMCDFGAWDGPHLRDSLPKPLLGCGSHLFQFCTGSYSHFSQGCSGTRSSGTAFFHEK
ncbi:hypothetical protein AVEN_168007-1 [Araneus ventricosus]|uniref:Uncharacterized protein n=1 Tax=Araneus ventricosus TaxID=182803 RepID=A0A4Y2JUP7_ARAVE|nr:hypothetical protein AVEN_168007-1 [Araneus ventricosus]